jgi:hypothetical protein
MFTRDSRYRDARRFVAESPQLRAFPGVRPRDIPATSGVLEHLISANDRLDRLAQHYYDDARLWWLIMDANPHLTFAGDILSPELLGSVILIPRLRTAGSGR